jgi:glutamate 5-kinase
MHQYSELYDIFDIVVAQVLLTATIGRIRFNARDTLLTSIGAFYPSSTNGTTATHEIRVGDSTISRWWQHWSKPIRSFLSASARSLHRPRHSKDAQLIQRQRIDDATWASGRFVRLHGGMVTKIQAAQLASRGGVAAVISTASVEQRILAGDSVGTLSQHAHGEPQTVVFGQRAGVCGRGRGAGAGTGGAEFAPLAFTVEDEFSRGMTLRDRAALRSRMASPATMAGVRKLWNEICKISG